MTRILVKYDDFCRLNINKPHPPQATIYRVYIEIEPWLDTGFTEDVMILGTARSDPTAAGCHFYSAKYSSQHSTLVGSLSCWSNLESVAPVQVPITAGWPEAVCGNETCPTLLHMTMHSANCKCSHTCIPTLREGCDPTTFCTEVGESDVLRL